MILVINSKINPLYAGYQAKALSALFHCLWFDFKAPIGRLDRKMLRTALKT